MNEENPDYNERELALVQEFYANLESDNFFRSFFTNPPEPVLPGIWVKKLIVDKKERTLARNQIEQNTVSFGTLNEKIFNNAIAYGNDTSVHLLTQQKASAAAERFQLVLDWMSINVRTGYNLNRSLDVELFKSTGSTDGGENSYDVVFDQQLGVLGPRNTIRIQMTYDKNAPILYTADSKPIERLPKSAIVFFEGKRFFELSLTGFVSEEIDSPGAGGISASLSKRTAGIYKFICGIKNAGKLYAIGDKVEFVKFKTEQQIRAAVVLHVAKVFCYASIWRIYFALLNSHGAFVEFVNNARWSNVAFDTAQNMDLLLLSKKDNMFFYTIEKDTESEEQGVLLETDKNGLKTDDVKKTLRFKFSEWLDDANRTMNVVTQAKRIQAHLFVPTETYQKFIDEKNKLIESTKDDLKKDVGYYEDLIQSNVGLRKDVYEYLDIDSVLFQRFNNDFSERLDWEKLNSDLWSVEVVKQRIFAAADYVRSNAQSQMAEILQFATVGETLPLFQRLVKLLVAQQFLKAAGYMTQIMQKYKTNVDVETITAPLRSSERKLAVFAARAMLSALPIERRTAGGKTEIFTSELEKIVSSNGGNGQVPVPELDVFNLMVGPINAMGGVNEEQIIFGFQEFYSQERFYFSEIVQIPWTASSLDEKLLRFDILSSTDRANALFKLSSDLLLFGKEVANAVDLGAEQNADVAQIVENFLALPRLIYNLIKKAVDDLSTDRSESDRNFSLQIVVALETALKNIGFYFDNVLSLESRTKVVESSARYNQLIATEKNVAEVLRMFKQEHTLAQRAPRLDENINNVVENILQGGADVMKFDAKFLRKTLFCGGRIDPTGQGALSQLLATFIENTRKPGSSIKNAEQDWKNRSKTYLDTQFHEDDVVVLFGQIQWLIDKYTAEQRSVNSPFQRLANEQDGKRKEQDLQEEFSERLKNIEEALEDAVFREKFGDLFKKNEAPYLVLSGVTILQSEISSLPLRAALIEAARGVQTIYEKTILMAQKTKDFFENSRRANVDASEKAATASTIYDSIVVAFRTIEEKKAALDRLSVPIPIYEQARKLLDSVSAAMKTLKSSMKPEDAQRLDLLTKQRELERLTEVRKQIESFKGQMGDALKELQMVVSKAEKADIEAAKYDSKLADFAKNIQSLLIRIDKYNASVDSAQKTLQSAGSADELRAKIEALERDFPTYDRVRQQLLADVPRLISDFGSLRKDIDKTVIDVEKVKKQEKELTSLYNKTSSDFASVSKDFRTFENNVNEAVKVVDAELADAKNIENVVKSRGSAIEERAKEIKRLQSESAKTVADAESIRAKVIRDDADIERINIELAKKVVEVRGTSKEFDSLLEKINYSFNQVTDIVDGKAQLGLASAITRAIVRLQETQPKPIDLAAVNSLVVAAEKRIINSLDAKIDDYLAKNLADAIAELPNKPGAPDQSQVKSEKTSGERKRKPDDPQQIVTQPKTNDDDDDEEESSSRKSQRTNTKISKQHQKRENFDEPTDDFASCLALLGITDK